MVSDLIINTPWWFLLLVILIGLAYAALLYSYNRKNKLGNALTVILFSFRFIAVSILAFLLLSPFLKTRSKQLEKPIIVFGIDNSRSMVLSKDSTLLKTQFIDELSTIKNIVSQDYDFDVYTFGQEVQFTESPTFDDEITNYADFITKMKEDYAGLNMGAMVIAGDGLNNRGIDPVFAATDINFPIYTIALGDTSSIRDLKINDVRYNSIVYLDDDFPIEVNVSAKKLEGNSALLKVFAFGKLQSQKQIKINKTQFNKSYSFLIPAVKPGKHRIRIMVETEAEEFNIENNARNVFIDVLDNRQKILLLANAPHPDIAAIKQSIELNKNYELEIAYAAQFRSTIEDFDLVILHQLPSIQYQMTGLLEAVNKKEIPVLYILGKQINTRLFNRNYQGIEFRSAGRNFEEALAIINPNFSFFSFDEELANSIEALPPLIVPLGNFQLLPNTTVFAFQRISNIETEYPLVAFSTVEGIKNGFIAGEGMWMWRIHNYLQNNNTKAFDTFIEKTVQLLLLRKDKRYFRTITKGEYSSNEDIIIQAELYNQSYEPVNQPDVNFTLTNEENEKFNYLFSPNNSAYLLNLKQLPVGVYKYMATTSLGGEKYRRQGEFVVSGESIESRVLQADHSMLYRLANQHEGEMLPSEALLTLPDLLKEKQNLQSKIYYEEKYTGLFNLWWVLGLILFLLSLEWFLRKYFGTY